MDGHSAQSYYKPDLQACIALLAQRHQLFNLSIAETIGIGDPDHANDRERIEQAARLGGAYDFVQRYNAGFDEIIQPVTTSYSSDYPADDQQLREVFDSIERQKDISGAWTAPHWCFRILITFVQVGSDNGWLRTCSFGAHHQPY